jgi:hypothetical protein
MLWSTRTNGAYFLLGKAIVGHHGFVGVFSNNDNLACWQDIMAIIHVGEMPSQVGTLVFPHLFYFHCQIMHLKNI